MSNDPAYYLELAAAYVRGKLAVEAQPTEHADLFMRPLEDLSPDEQMALVTLGKANKLRVHRFKRTMDLPRVRRVLGALRGLQPLSLLDIGSGRGAFLWPLLDAFPDLNVTAIDLLDHRVADIMAVRAGGVTRLDGVLGSATTLPFPDRAFDVITMLEVLEHIPDTSAALAEVCRVADRFLVLSVPSKPDDNPEHIHLFSEETLVPLLKAAGMTRVSYEYVLNHLIAVARR